MVISPAESSFGPAGVGADTRTTPAGVVNTPPEKPRHISTITSFFPFNAAFSTAALALKSFEGREPGAAPKHTSSGPLPTFDTLYT